MMMSVPRRQPGCLAAERFALKHALIGARLALRKLGVNVTGLTHLSRHNGQVVAWLGE